MTAASAKYCLVSLARQAVEEYLVRGQVIRPPATARLARAACFVCIKTLDGKLRGCMGTVEPSQPSLAEEVIANAINAATRDPRFCARLRRRTPVATFFSRHLVGTRTDHARWTGPANLWPLGGERKSNQTRAALAGHRGRRNGRTTARHRHAQGWSAGQ